MGPSLSTKPVINKATTRRDLSPHPLGATSYPQTTNRRQIVDFSTRERLSQMTVAETKTDREAAFHLVHDVYHRSGLMAEHPWQMRVIRHHLLPTTDVFVARWNERVEFSATLIRDGDYRLPCESVFGEQVHRMRTDGLRLAELSCVASAADCDDRGNGFKTFVRMIALTIQAARWQGVDRLLFAVHPRHAKFYRRMFGCNSCADVRRYHAVKSAPAVLCSHDFAALDETKYRLFDQIYGIRFSSWQMKGRKMSHAEKQFFRKALECSKSDFLPMAA